MSVGVRGGVLLGGGGVGGGDVQSDGIDDKFMQLFDSSCNLYLQNLLLMDMHVPVLALEI